MQPISQAMSAEVCGSVSIALAMHTHGLGSHSARLQKRWWLLPDRHLPRGPPRRRRTWQPCVALQGGRSLGAGELFITQGGSNSTLKMPKIRRDTVMAFCFIRLVPATILQLRSSMAEMRETHPCNKTHGFTSA